MNFIDTHSHIYGEEFDEDREAVIQRAKDVGIKQIFLPNENEKTLGLLLKFCRKHPGYLFPMIGLHPEEIDDNCWEVLNRMHQLLQPADQPFIAVGEVGLDYYWDKSKYDLQQKVFEEQIQWAIEKQLPLMIHARSAHKELVSIISKYKEEKLTGVFHCFSGTRDEAEELLQFEGFVLGIGGVLTFKKSTLPETLIHIPLDRIVIETDAPYLAPVPQRGKRNEPSFAIHTLNKIAELMHHSTEDVAERTNNNVERIFRCANTQKSIN